MMRCFLLIAALASAASEDATSTLVPKESGGLRLTGRTPKDTPAMTHKVESAPPKQTQETPAQRPSRDPALVSLGSELTALRQRRANILQLEKSIGSTAALIKEGTQMEKAATSRRARQIYDSQVRNTQRLQKETAGMLVA